MPYEMECLRLDISNSDQLLTKSNIQQTKYSHSQTHSTMRKYHPHLSHSHLPYCTQTLLFARLPTSSILHIAAIVGA